MKGKISVFEPKSMDWTTNGEAILMPTSCEVTEQAGGEYELEMVHPCDEWGKWEYLIPDAIIRVPVPTQVIPKIDPLDIAYWRVKTTVTAKVIVYAKPLIYTYTTPPTSSAWNPTTSYQQGTYVTYGGNIYRHVGMTTVSAIVPSSSPLWQKVSEYNPSGNNGNWTGGGKVGQLKAGDVFLKLGTYNSEWMRVRIADGLEGYVKITYCEYYGEMSDAFPERTITTQCFRIYRVTTDSEDMSVTVNARHISYDLYNIVVGACEVLRATPSTAIMLLQAAMQLEDVRTIATNISDVSVTADWSWNNAVYALLDEEVGIVKQLNAKLLRDNNDLFVLKNDTVDNGFTIEYGKNLVGVNWYVDIENVITRILPRSQNSNGTTLLLPEGYMDSEFIEDYAAIRMEQLDCGYKVGQSYKEESGTTITLTADDCYRLMRRDCMRRYNVDNADIPDFSLQVEFVNLGDTEEYKQYKNLQRLALYDTVRIKHSPLSFDTKMQMRAYTWDAINLRYVSATFEGIYDDLHTEQLVTRPEKAMTDMTQYGLTVSASTTNAYTNRAFYSFNYDLTTGWIPEASNTRPWIQIALDVPLKAIKVFVYSRNTSSFSHPTGGFISASIDGTSYTHIGEFSGWAKRVGGLVGIIECDNYSVAYKYIRLVTTERSADTDLMSIGYLYLTGIPQYE